MEKRIGTITLLITDRSQAADVNRIISEYANIVLCRQGLPFRDERAISVISLIVEGTVNEINGICGKLGRLNNVQAKAVVTSSVAQSVLDGTVNATASKTKP
ncbi:MAG: TM1266 family iron-only hydrogenase system putative regulator [Bacteroidales bacterium]|nr:TM1266 family iron-only hydrogenase system putative regulator [Bacteroidales bacterium]